MEVDVLALPSSSLVRVSRSCVAEGQHVPMVRSSRQAARELITSDAVLGIGEGVLAVDSASRVSVRNDEAERLLGTPLPAGSRHCPNWTCPPRLHQAVAEGQAVDNLLAVAVNPGSARFPTGCAHSVTNSPTGCTRCPGCYSSDTTAKLSTTCSRSRKPRQRFEARSPTRCQIRTFRHCWWRKTEQAQE
jgi:hypothetical protein